MPTRSVQPAKTVGSSKNYTWDFLSDLAAGETLAGATVAISVYSGNDPAPNDLLLGSASVSGSIATQKLTGGVLGVLYEALCTVTTSLGQTLTQASFIAIIPDLS